MQPENLSAFLDDLGLTQEEKEKINYKNAEQLLNIK
ncbi:hypothetical protein MNY58_00425 [Staphylococcus edaphicus]|uniref:Amidohydrolase-related domain-containing protein n=1 Tax=Staphylococcus edaphicus TaxID=1955013 RepID=A0ABY4QE15_9STAP|nr:hypothetical protein MNY58_00425 [Staphylococcus edaphicus]